MITLRPYQNELINKARAEMQAGIKSLIICAPCGSGKTLLTAQMLKTAAQKGMPSIFIVHRRELIHQSSQAFNQVGLHHGIISSGFPETNRPLVQIASIQTLKNRLDKIRRPKLIVFDECHHSPAKSWDCVYKMFPDAYVIGLTATPHRLDGTGLGKWFQKIIYGPSMEWLIINGYLSSYKIFAPQTVNVARVHIRMGDFVNSELSALVDKPTITGDAIKEYKRLANGKRTLVRGVSIQHSQHIVEQFRLSGIFAIHVDGDTSIRDRDCAINLFRKGDIRILSNVDLFGEGLDIPSVECVIDLRPTQSLTLWIQFCGRALRPEKDKSHAIIIDHAGNVQRHGLPCDYRQWSLDGRERKKSADQEIKIKLCKKCYGANQSWRTECQYCKEPFAVESREVAEINGDLKEVDISKVRQERKIEQGMAQTLQQLIEVGKKRNYRSPERWAYFVMKARNGKKKQKVIW